jgi:hypothetical protein
VFPGVFGDLSECHRTREALARNALRDSRLCITGIVVLLLPAYVLFCITFVPAIEPYRPVKEMRRTIRATASPLSEVGYFRAAAPSMAFYLQRPIFEEYDGDAMVRSVQADRQVFCIPTEKDYDYLVGARDLILHVLDRRPRLVTNLRSALNEHYAAEQVLLLATNRSDQEAGTREGRITP